MEKKYDIFISYRREGGKAFARIIKAELEKRDLTVFLDFDELKDGVFDRRIMDAIRSSSVFLFILSRGSLDRCKYKGDWVSEEILYASKENIHIVPVEVDKSFRTMPSDVPGDIRKILGAHSWAQIDTENLLRASMDQMVLYNIQPYISNENRQNPKGAEIHVMADTDCVIYRFNQQVCSIERGEDAVIRLNPGNHRLRFVSKEFSDIDFVIKKYNVPDLFYSDIIDVELEELVQAKRKAEEERRAEEEAKRRAEIEAIIRAAEEAKRKDEEERLEQFQLKPFEQNGKYGFIDETGRVVIPCQWKDVNFFSEGLAGVKDENEKWGFIDKTGRVVIPCRWKEACFFSEGLARVQGENWEWGFIDKNGRVVIPCRWVDALHFYEGLAAVKDKNIKWGYIDKTGRVVIPCQWKEAVSFSEGLAIVKDNNDVWKYIDKSGAVVEE